MGWRIVSVSSVAKLDYKMDYLVIRNQEGVKRVHLSEIAVLILESTAISMTAYLLRELSRNHSDPLDDWEDLVKLMDFHVDEAELGFSERLLEYMELNRRFFGKTLFVFYNLKALMSPEEMALFFRDALYRKFALLLLEDCQRYSIEEYEKVIIVDKDLCVF